MAAAATKAGLLLPGQLETRLEASIQQAENAYLRAAGPLPRKPLAVSAARAAQLSEDLLHSASR